MNLNSTMGVVITAIACLMSCVSTVEAVLVFTEVMYNPPGADEGREWIEVYNSGIGRVNVSEWRLLEGGVTHTLKPVPTQAPPNHDELIEAGEYAVIVDSPTDFLSDNPSYGKTILDSSWGSLSNTGESLGLTDPDGKVVSNLTYDSKWGGNENGYSIEKRSLGGGDDESNWGESTHAGGTPGERNSVTAAETTTSSTSTTSTTIRQETTTTLPPTPAPEFPAKSTVVYSLIAAVGVAYLLATRMRRG